MVTLNRDRFGEVHVAASTRLLEVLIVPAACRTYASSFRGPLWSCRRSRGRIERYLAPRTHSSLPLRNYLTTQAARPPTDAKSHVVVSGRRAVRDCSAAEAGPEYVMTTMANSLHASQGFLVSWRRRCLVVARWQRPSLPADHAREPCSCRPPQQAPAVVPGRGRPEITMDPDRRTAVREQEPRICRRAMRADIESEAHRRHLSQRTKPDVVREVKYISPIDGLEIAAHLFAPSDRAREAMRRWCGCPRSPRVVGHHMFRSSASGATRHVIIAPDYRAHRLGEASTKDRYCGKEWTTGGSYDI